MSILSQWLLPDSAQTQAEADANYERQLGELNRSLEQRREAANISAQQEAFYRSNTGELASQDQAAAAGFAEGLGEGLDNITSGVNKTLAGTVNSIFKAIPLQVWVIAVVVLFVWMGGMTMLRGRLAKV